MTVALKKHPDPTGRPHRPLITYDQIIQAEIANELLNSARGLLYERADSLNDAQPIEAKRLTSIAIDLYGLQRRIRVGEEDLINEIMATWQPRLKDMDRFWREV